MNDSELMLVDLSSIAFPIWMMAQNDPDPNATSTRTIERVRALTTGYPHCAICCDAGRSFRKDADPTYKANREKQHAAYYHQVGLVKEALAGDGYPVWAVDGFEADDLIASATWQAISLPDPLEVRIVSSDKDLLQLVSKQVRAVSAKDGAIYDPELVHAKFGVSPSQMVDYLSLVGDPADNIKGADKIGTVTAAKLLAEFGSLEGVYLAMKNGATPSITPAVRSSLVAFAPRLLAVRALIELRTDVAIPFDEIARERIAKETAAFQAEEESIDQPLYAGVEQDEEHRLKRLNDIADAQPAPVVTVKSNGKPTPVDDLAPPPMEWERHLEPRSIREAITLSNHMFASKLFSAYGTPQAVLSVILAGREFGMQAMASLRAFHVVDGKPTMAADVIRALVLNSGKAKYFRCTERTAERATFVTQRGDDPPVTLSYSVEEAKAAGMVRNGGGWTKNPADMCVARAGSKLARLVYPDVIHGLYSPEEFDA